MQGEPPALVDLRRRRPDLADVAVDEFALRDRLVTAVLAGEKMASASLLVEYEVEG